MCILADDHGFDSGQTINGDVLQSQHGGEVCYNPKLHLVAPYMVSGLQDPGFLKEIGRIFAISLKTFTHRSETYTNVSEGYLEQFSEKTPKRL